MQLILTRPKPTEKETIWKSRKRRFFNLGQRYRHVSLKIIKCLYNCYTLYSSHRLVDCSLHKFVLSRNCCCFWLLFTVFWESINLFPFLYTFVQICFNNATMHYILPFFSQSQQGFLCDHLNGLYQNGDLLFPQYISYDSNS